MTTTPPKPNAPATPPGLSSQLQAALAAAGSTGQTAEGGAASIVAQQTPPAEVEVDEGGGVVRRVPVKDLVSTWQQKTVLEQQRAALQQSLAEAGQNQALRALHDRLGALPPERRAQVLALLEGDGGQSADDDGIDDAVGEALGGKRTTPAQAGVAPDMLAWKTKVDQVLNLLASHIGPQMEQQRQLTSEERVAQLMASYPIFGKDAGGAVAAKHFIAREVARNQGADLEALVRQAASMLQKVHTDSAQRVETAAQTNPLAVAKGTLSAQGLKSGDVRRAALAALQSR